MPAPEPAVRAEEEAVSRVLAISAVFLILQVLAMRAILASNRRTGPVRLPRQRPQGDRPAMPDGLSIGQILEWEFAYARTTASEAMQDRHTMINFYLIIVGLIAGGVVALLRDGNVQLQFLISTLLWLLCLLGWFYFLMIIRFRQAWHDSARAMNRIKDFYISHAREFAPEQVHEAFLWQSDSLPAPDRPWTVHFYSAMLVAFVNSVAFVAGGLFLDLNATGASPAAVLFLVLLGIVLFAFHIWLYFAFLTVRPSAAHGQGSQDAGEGA
jgi:hypothetical protein